MKSAMVNDELILDWKSFGDAILKIRKGSAFFECHKKINLKSEIGSKK